MRVIVPVVVDVAVIVRVPVRLELADRVPVVELEALGVAVRVTVTVDEAVLAAVVVKVRVEVTVTVAVPVPVGDVTAVGDTLKLLVVVAVPDRVFECELEPLGEPAMEVLTVTVPDEELATVVVAEWVTVVVRVPLPLLDNVRVAAAETLMLSVDAVLRVVLTVMVPVGVAELETVTVLVDDSDTGLEAVAVGEPELVPVIVPAALEPVAVTVGEKLPVRVGDLVIEMVAEALGTAAALPVLDTDGVPVIAFDWLPLGVLRVVLLCDGIAVTDAECDAVVVAEWVTVVVRVPLPLLDNV